jgi:hypothetical protein
MKTTLELPDELVRAVKLRALYEGRKLKDAVADLLRKGLSVRSEGASQAPRPTFRSHPKTGLPYIECPPSAPARRMTTAELLALEDATQTQQDLEEHGVSPR